MTSDHEIRWNKSRNLHNTTRQDQQKENIVINTEKRDQLHHTTFQSWVWSLPPHKGHERKKIGVRREEGGERDIVRLKQDCTNGST